MSSNQTTTPPHERQRRHPTSSLEAPNRATGEPLDGLHNRPDEGHVGGRQPGDEVVHGSGPDDGAGGGQQVGLGDDTSAADDDDVVGDDLDLVEQAAMPSR
jgi:hypothetical protein